MEAKPSPSSLLFHTTAVWHKEDRVYYYRIRCLRDHGVAAKGSWWMSVRISLVERRTPFITITLTAHQSTWFLAQDVKKRVWITTIIFIIITHVRNLRKNVECRNSLCGRSSFGGIVPYFWVGSCDPTLLLKLKKRSRITTDSVGMKYF